MDCKQLCPGHCLNRTSCNHVTGQWMLMDGTDSIVTRRVLDTVSTMLHVTRELVCVTEPVLPVGQVINVMKVRYTRAYKQYRN